MALASLKSRIERLEAKHKVDAEKVVAKVGGEYGHLVVDPDKPGHLIFSQPPGGFKAYAKTQQAELQAELLRLFANTTDEDPQPSVRPVTKLVPL